MLKKRYEGGLTSSLDLRMSMANKSFTQANLNMRKAQYENVLRQLEILIGKYPSATIVISEKLPKISAEVPKGLPSELLSRRPDLVSAERKVASADASLSSAKRNLLPRISLTGSSGTSTNELEKLLDGDYGVWSIAGNILAPLFNRGRLKAGVSLAKSTSEIAYEQYANTVLTAFGEVENSLANERYLSKREAALKDAVEQAIAARKLAEDKYSKGVINLTTMLQAQISAYENESMLLSVNRERLNARADLHLALGGGFDKKMIELKTKLSSK